MTSPSGSAFAPRGRGDGGGAAAWADRRMRPRRRRARCPRSGREANRPARCPSPARLRRPTSMRSSSATRNSKRSAPSRKRALENEAKLKREIESIGDDRRKLNQQLIDTAARVRSVEDEHRQDAGAAQAARRQRAGACGKSLEAAPRRHRRGAGRAAAHRPPCRRRPCWSGPKTRCSRCAPP